MSTRAALLRWLAYLGLVLLAVACALITAWIAGFIPWKAP